MYNFNLLFIGNIIFAVNLLQCRIAVYGFGDSRSTDRSVFSLSVDPLNHTMLGENIRDIYNQTKERIKPNRLTSFAPIINKAIHDCVTGNQSYSVLLILVKDGCRMKVNQIQETIQSVEDASRYPISIIVIGLGQGPWNVVTEIENKSNQSKYSRYQR